MTGLVKNSRTCEEITMTTSQWTPEAIRALGATTDLPTLGSIFGLGRWRSYQMAHTGEWEQAGIRIIRIGARYRVTIQSILDVLGFGGTNGTGTSSDQAALSPGHAPGNAWQRAPLRSSGSASHGQRA
jgi:hypothetical protein